jgi:hypothetical protein
MSMLSGDARSLSYDAYVYLYPLVTMEVTRRQSITMYDAEGFQTANELDRVAIGDRDPLAFNADGSLDILIQHTNPGPEREPKWLPAPHGPLGITMRLYAPKPEALNGGWVPPPVTRR